ncbi:MAG: hypothetical protein RLZZ408_127 [Verrucomicrobiota bacterium]
MMATERQLLIFERHFSPEKRCRSPLGWGIMPSACFSALPPGGLVKGVSAGQHVAAEAAWVDLPQTNPSRRASRERAVNTRSSHARVSNATTTSGGSRVVACEPSLREDARRSPPKEGSRRDGTALRKQKCRSNPQLVCSSHHGIASVFDLDVNKGFADVMGW